MRLFPVLDLKDGKVMRACGGRREAYLPLTSTLFSDSSPLSVIARLLELYPFQQLYVADLDAIMGRGHHHRMLAKMAQCYPALQLWVDGGTATPEAAGRLLDLGVTRPVIGTETLPDLESWRALQDSPWAARLVLSMDYRKGEFLGPPALAAQPALWPSAIIAMSLDRVGGKGGPDWPLLARLKQDCHSGGRELFAAGGVRGLEDLYRLAIEGMGGVLLASALYDDSLGAAELRQLS